MHFGECSGRVQTIVVDMRSFVKSCISTLRAGGAILAKSIPNGGEGKFLSHAYCVVVTYLSQGMAANIQYKCRDSNRKVCLSKLLKIWLVLLVLKLLGKCPAIFGGSRICRFLKAWGKCIKIVGVSAGNKSDTAVNRSLLHVQTV